jgi:hydroxymethylpyrimidine/phosphomethylpyrimidine kinase
MGFVCRNVVDLALGVTYQLVAHRADAFGIHRVLRFVLNIGAILAGIPMVTVIIAMIGQIGMLANVAIVHAVAEALAKYHLPLILDPVILSTSGHRLLSEDAQESLKHKLLPLSTLVTPNIPEMRALTNMPLATFEDKERAAQHLMEYGARAVLLKGGHEEGETKSDILFSASQNGIYSTIFSSPTVQTRNTHGTGCTLSAAIAAYMARGLSMEDAVKEAKIYVSEAIRTGADVSVGNGFGPVNHSFNPLEMSIILINNL